MPTRSGELIRFLAQFRRALREGPLSREQARAAWSRDLETREEGFLGSAERYIYGNASSPYRPLLDRAGCELGDLRRMVEADGLERTLERLYAEGVFVTLSEFKGRRPIVRGDLVVEPLQSAFDRPGIQRGLRSSSGGSTGRPTTVWVDLPGTVTMAVHRTCADEAMGLLDQPLGLWADAPPAPHGLATHFELALSGRRLDAWFVAPSGHARRTRLRSRALVDAVSLVLRSSGYVMQRPKSVPLEQAFLIARWAADNVRRNGSCVVRGHVSRAVRVALGATGSGIDLTGVTFTCGGEPLTPAKRAEIERSGARVIPHFLLAEVGAAGFGCSSPIGSDDSHINDASIAVIGAPRTLPGSQTVVDEIVISTVGLGTSKVLLNLATDDFAILQERDCGCPMSGLGLSRHLRGIRSFSKLTGEAVTLLGDDALAVVEEVLPRRFGGSSLDYQLVEEEDGGLTRLTVVVSPRIELRDEDEVVKTVLDGLGSTGLARDIKDVWGKSGSVRVRRAEPTLTSGGKAQPIRTLGGAGRA